MKLQEEIRFDGLEVSLEFTNQSGAHYCVMNPDDGRGCLVVGSLDVHYQCGEESAFYATLAIEDQHKFKMTPRELAPILLKEFGMPTGQYWDIRIWRFVDGAVDDNNPRKTRR